MSGQELVDELRKTSPYRIQAEELIDLCDRAADIIEAQAKAVDTWTEMAARRHRALGEVEASYREAIARAERAEQKSAELAAVITEALAAFPAMTDRFDAGEPWDLIAEETLTRVERTLESADSSAFSAYTTRIREEALGQVEWEYAKGFDGWGDPEFVDGDDADYWQSRGYEVVRRRKAGPWSEIPKGQN